MARVWVEVRDRSGIRSRSVVDLRVVDILVVDVKFDMDELTTLEFLVIGTLAGLSYPTRPWIWALRLRPLEKPGIYVLP